MPQEEKFLKAIQQLRKTEKKRNFDQTIDLIINLKNFDIRKNALNLFVQVPNKVKDKRIAGFFEKKSDVVDTIKQDDFIKFKEKKDFKKLIKDYDFFIANAKMMPAIATTFGRTLGPAFCQVQGNGFEGIFRDGKGGGILTFSIPDSELLCLKGDIIEGDSADLNGP